MPVSNRYNSGGGGGSGLGAPVTVFGAPTALQLALKRAEAGLTWEYPCLIWLADYIRDETGRDPAADWRAIDWTEATAKRELAKLALQGDGKNAVDRALSVIAARDHWVEADAPMQGAIMVGVFDLDGEGTPAIFDDQRLWISSVNGRGWTVTAHRPDRIWELPGR